MSTKRTRSPSKSPPQLSMPWMAQGRTMVQALVLSPTRSPLLTSISRPQETTFSNQSPVTPGQGQRLQIAETVRLETFKIVIISLFAETTEAKTLEILTAITAFTFFHSFSLEVKFKLTEFGHWNKLNVHEPKMFYLFNFSRLCFKIPWILIIISKNTCLPPNLYKQIVP